jgi:hypothetical protein
LNVKQGILSYEYLSEFYILYLRSLLVIYEWAGIKRIVGFSTLDAVEPIQTRLVARNTPHTQQGGQPAHVETFPLGIGNNTIQVMDTPIPTGISNSQMNLVNLNDRNIPGGIGGQAGQIMLNNATIPSGIGNSQVQLTNEIPIPSGVGGKNGMIQAGIYSGIGGKNGMIRAANQVPMTAPQHSKVAILTSTTNMNGFVSGEGVNMPYLLLFNPGQNSFFLLGRPSVSQLPDIFRQNHLTHVTFGNINVTESKKPPVLSLRGYD